VPQAISLPPSVWNWRQMSGGPASAGDSEERHGSKCNERINVVMNGNLLPQSDGTMPPSVRL